MLSGAGAKTLALAFTLSGAGFYTLWRWLTQEIPYSLDNPKEEKDSKGNPCVVHTICFNTHCYEPFSRDKCAPFLPPAGLVLSRTPIQPPCDWHAEGRAAAEARPARRRRKEFLIDVALENVELNRCDHPAPTVLLPYRLTLLTLLLAYSLTVLLCYCLTLLLSYSRDGS
jgi:hypothetical protein